MTHLSKQGIEALTKVAEWLEAGAPHVQVSDDIEIGHFNMEYAVVADPDDGGCGTACCIAGAVCQFEMLGFDERSDDGDLNWNLPSRDEDSNVEADNSAGGAFFLAADYLGMNYDDAEDMFSPFSDGLDLHVYKNPAIAALVVRRFIETGEVNWVDISDNYFENN